MSLETPIKLNSVYNCSALDLLRSLDKNSVDLVFIDPPYGHNNNDGDLASRREIALGRDPSASAPRPIMNDGPEANDIFREALPEIRRVLKPGACLCCCCSGGSGASGGPQYALWSLMIDEVMDFKQMVVWDKGPMGLGWHYRRSYEVVLIGQIPGAACKWYDTTERVENIIRPGDYGIRKIIPTANDHPTPKPVALSAHFINLHTQPGDLVVDCFCGGGSTGVAARKLERSYLLCDLDPTWAEYSRDRIANSDPYLDKVVRPGVVQPSLFQIPQEV